MHSALISTPSVYGSYNNINNRLLQKRQTSAQSYLNDTSGKTPTTKYSLVCRSALKSAKPRLDEHTKKLSFNSSRKFPISLDSPNQFFKSNKSILKSRSKSTILYDELKRFKIRKKASLPVLENSDTDSCDDNFTSDFTKLSITDFCKKPSSSRFTSNLSTEAQYALIKTYEDMIYFEMLVNFPKLDSLIEKGEIRVKKKYNTKLTEEQLMKYNIQPREDTGLEESVDRPMYKEYKLKIRFSHFIESAQLILDAIENYKLANCKKQYLSELTDEDLQIEARKREYKSKKMIRKIVGMYKKWVFLWNKEYNNQF